MTSLRAPKKIAFLADYVPRQCGIATFAHDVRTAVAAQYPGTECVVLAVNDRPEGYDYPPEVRFEFNEQDIHGYERAADFLTFSHAEVLCLQHEYGIFGGPAGAHLLALLRDVRLPVVTTLHTILEKPDRNQRRVLDEVAALSARLVVMTERARGMLRGIYGVENDRIDLIPHGIPDTPFVDPAFYKDQFGVEGRRVILTFGLLSPGKGVEHMIRALPEIVRRHSDVVYIILGATHPNLVRDQGEAYRLSLERLVAELGVKRHVAFYNRFVDLEELKEFIGAADLYVTPYLNPAQAVSGTLAYCFGAGKAVVSTPYWHAEELLADGRGVLVPFADPATLAREVSALLEDDARRNAMRKRAYLMGREMVWNQVAHLYFESFQKARASRAAAPRRFTVRSLEQERPALPDIRLDHLHTLTDSTGILQHSVLAIPDYAHGYCTDDNARALLLTVLLEETGDSSPAIRRLASHYAAFLHHAFAPESGRFRNFMGYERRWLEECGSDDSHGRAIHALGTLVGRASDRNTQIWAAQLFDRALHATAALTSPRAWALALLGIHEYLRRLSGDRAANQTREILAERIIGLFRATASEDWPWFENIVSYDNARLPHALLLCGRWTGNQEALDIAYRALRWLCANQKAAPGYFRPIGSDGFWPRGGARASFDQQPLEACATVSACLEAYLTSQDSAWLDEAFCAFDWFLGRNDLGLPVYHAPTGGCRDAIHPDRLNLNMGAESTLAFLISLQEMRLVEAAVQSHGQPVEPDKSANSSFTPDKTVINP